MESELLAHPAEESVWARFEALPAPERERVVDALKDALDREVRAHPGEALAIAAVLYRAGELTPSRRALALRGRAVARHVNDLTDEALGDYTAAIELYDAAGEEVEAGKLRRALIDLHHLAGRTREAMECADAAREVFERHGEERQLAQLEVNVGNAYFRQDDHAAAGERYAAAADRFRALGDPLGTGIAEYNRGNVEVYTGRHEDAAGAYRAARAVFAEAGMDAHVADCDYGLAWLESMRCRFAEAIRGLEEARERFAGSDRPSRASLCDLDLAELYLRLDARWDAIEHASRAEERFRELGLRYERAKARAVRGLARLRTDDAAGAAEDLDGARRTFEELENPTLGAALRMQRFAADEGDDALAELRRSHVELGDGTHRLLADMSRLALARALTHRGEAAEALALLRSRGSPEGDLLVAVELLRARAEAQLALGDRAGAIDSLRRAVERIDGTYALVPGTDARTAFFRDRHGAFVTLALLVLQENGDARAALGLLERGRARGALEGRARSEDDDVQHERERLDALLLRRLDAELGALTGNVEGTVTAPSDDELLAAERELLRRSRDRGLASDERGLAADDFERAVPGDELALCYVLSPDGAGVLAVERGNVAWRPLSCGDADLRAAIDHLQLQLAARLRGRGHASREAQLVAATHRILDELGEMLLGPVADLLRGRPLTIVPYGPLHELPFHALRVDGEPLAERHPVGYAPSLRTLARCRGRARSGTSSVLACGAEEESLPSIAEELAALDDAYRGELALVPPGELVARLRADGPAGGILHLAAHGTYQPHNPVFSGLRFADTFLTAYDVRALSLGFDVVTLSGCETGRRGRLRGEELIGPDQAFLAAGARSVVSSLWVVEDATALLLMRELHARLAAGASVREALNEAQRTVRAAAPHPFDWAPFVLQGDPEAGLEPAIRP